MRIVLFLLTALPSLLIARENAPDDAAVVEFMTGACFACHGPAAPEEQRIAPPMIAVKRHYLDAGIDRDQFIEAIAAFVAGPTEDQSLMPGAVRRFGVMPPMSHDDAKVRSVAAYLYDNEIKQPDWFEAHWQNRGGGQGQGSGANPGAGRPGADLPPAERGRAIANATKAQLGKNLLAALNSEGAAHAVAFCNEQALPLTATMAGTYGVAIRRVSDRPRNPGNRADGAETAYIAEFQAAIDASEPIKPLVTTRGTTTTTYLPIVTNAMCLQCHGSVDEAIEPATLARIQTLYPEDEAIGYGENQVRGIWRIRWED